MARAKDYSQFINTKHNHLLITAIPNGSSAECLCDCGKATTKTNLHKLLAGKVMSCKSCSNKLNGKKGTISASASSPYNELIGTNINYFTVLRRAEGIDEPPGTFYCKCICGEIRFIDAFELTKAKERKSCGCQQSRLLSLSHGGTGIPYSEISVNEFIRKNTSEYNEWVKQCLYNQKFTCFVSGKIGGNLNVHHLTPLKTLIELFQITKENYLTYGGELFRLGNGIVLSEDIHKDLHSTYGNLVSIDNIITYRKKYYPVKSSN